jgi:tetratricopeptide (TPR) repeat protein
MAFNKVARNPRGRRPVWQPHPWLRFAAPLRRYGREITIKRLAIALALAVFIAYIDREVLNDALIIEAFSVPKRYEETGLTSEGISSRIGDALNRMYLSTRTSMHKDRLQLGADQAASPDVEVPGTKLSLRTIVEIVRQLLGADSRHVRGEIAFPLTADLHPSDRDVEITFRIIQGKNRTVLSKVRAPANDPDMVAQRVAESILRNINPYILAVYRFNNKDKGDARAILLAIVADSTRGRKYVSAAYSALGNIALSDDALGVGTENLKRALDYFRKATELNPKNADAYISWGIVLSKQERLDNAIAFIRKAIQLDPQSADAYEQWGVIFVKQGKLDEAIAKFRKATELDPKHPDAYGDWGAILHRQGKLDEAIVQLGKQIDVTPKDPDPYTELGLVLEKQGKLDEAIEHFRKAVELDPSHVDAYDSWGFILDKQGKSDEAIAQFRRAIEVDPKSVDSFINWGAVLDKQGKPDEAIAQFRRATEVDPTSADAWDWWGAMLEKKGKPEEAAAMHRKAATLPRSDGSARIKYRGPL